MSLADTDDVLAIELDVARVAYVSYTSTSTAAAQTSRHKLLQSNSGGLDDCYIPTVQVSAAGAVLWIFRILQASAEVDDILKFLGNLSNEGLQIKEEPQLFSPAHLYPCSEECSYQSKPCSHCINPPSTSSAPPRPPTSSASRLPRRSLRAVWSAFLQAARGSIIADIATRAENSASGRAVNRIKDGFLLGHAPSRLSPRSEWTAGWEGRIKGKPLVYTHIHLHLTGEKLIIHPTLHPTPFIPLAAKSLQQGAPITLLPYGTPAYYLSTYSGPTSTLAKQFREALQGCGVSLKFTAYVIIWIPVENAHGEEKGLTAIYPTELCVSFIPTPGTVPPLVHRSTTSSPISTAPPPFPTTGPWTPYGRSLLPTIPTLPPPLQPSPTVLHVVPPGFSAPSPNPAIVLSGSSYIPTPPATTLPVPVSATVPTSPYSTGHPVSSSFPPLFPPPYAISITPNERLSLALSRSYSLTFKARRQRQHKATFHSVQTSLSKSPDTILSLTHATEASGFVDMTAKEREKERERLRAGVSGRQTQDNQSSSQGQQSSTSQTRTAAPTQTQATEPVSHPPTIQTPYPNIAQPGPSTAHPFQPQQYPQSTFYPSPPDPHGSVPPIPLKVEVSDTIEQPITGPSQPEPPPQKIEPKDEESMDVDDDDLFGVSPPPSAENPDPIVKDSPKPEPPAVTETVDVKPDAERDDWDAMNMDWGAMDNMSMDLDMDMDMGMGMGMDMSMGMDAFGFGSSSSSSESKTVSSSLPVRPPLPPPPQTQPSVNAAVVTAPVAVRSVPTTVTSVSMTKPSSSLSFEDDITDDDYNWFDTHDTGGSERNDNTSGFMGISTSGGTNGSLDAGATLFSAISTSHPSAHSIQPFSSRSMHPPPVPPHAHHGFGYAPSPASTSASPWTSHAHIGHGETPDTMGTPSVAISMSASGDAFPLSPPEEGTPNIIGMLAGTPQTPNTAVINVTGGRWGSGWGVQLESPFSSPERKASTSTRATANSRRLSSFDPIPFAASHRLADGKYTCGKFTLPSPPLEGEEADSYFSAVGVKGNADTNGSSGLSPALKGLRINYDKKTDPRIAVVAQLRLRGVKRKSTASPALPGTRYMSPRWVKEWEEGLKATLPISPASMNDSDDDNSASDDEDNDSDDDLFDLGTSTSSPTAPEYSRPTTPLPAYVPPGPTLLSTHFHHTHLLPLSTPLRSPGTRHEETHLNNLSGNGSLNAAAASVPTPVSPAAMLGAAAEQSKSLEATAEMVAREVVENSLWGEIWTMNHCFGKHSDLSGTELCAVSDMSIDDGLNASMGPELAKQQVWTIDIHVVKELLSGVSGLKGPLTLGNVFDPVIPSVSVPHSPAPSTSHTVHPLQPPHLAVGKGDGVLEVLPTALRFWEKLGLGPKYGQKNATAFVLFDDDDEWCQQRVEVWLSNFAGTYQRKGLGNIVPGTSTFCSRDGLVPLRFDSSFRKNLASFATSLPASQTNFIFFVIIPSSAMILSSPLLRQVLSTVKKAVKNYSEAQIVFQLLPEEILLGHMDVSSVEDLGTEQLCYSVYDRILRPVDRTMAREFFEHGVRVRNYFQEPFTTLGRTLGQQKVTYVNSAHASLDVMDRHTLLHVGYQVSYCGKWILAAIIDQRGEAHDLGVWLARTHDSDADDAVSDEMHTVSKVWDFALRFAERADVEWRIVFAKLGLITAAELDAWTSLLASRLQVVSSRTPIHVSLLSIEPSAPWAIFPKRLKPSTPLSSQSSTSIAKAPALSRSSSMPSKASLKNGAPYFIDGSQTTYALFHNCSLTVSRAPTMESVGITSNIITDKPHGSSEGVRELPLLPLCSCTLVRMPASTSSPPTSIITPNMVDLHLMHAAGSRGSTYPPTSRNHSANDSEASTSHPSTATLHRGLMNDILYSYYALSVLSASRSKLSGVNPLLPFNLGAVEAMRNALSFGRIQVDGND
ncbi:proteophosphoglycan ppg4 [Moniliophthora roreri MCA 2997]|uniref:Mediator of RNA polymerase II transcription subunit 13 n=2 Tax=Moniliophthora roreri TaxID=221103 RepID=V2X648_MONRO|nr:proteophosphoglycan ppg4 [Moniliophthora roreri MCA 2997]KAI3616949.1 proteophosphoglycan ppg4 [Moniliophthora roreri]